MRHLTPNESRHIAGGIGEFIAGVAITSTMVGCYYVVKSYFKSDTIDPKTCRTVYEAHSTVTTFENEISLYDSQGNEYTNVSSVVQTCYLPVTVCY